MWQALNNELSFERIGQQRCNLIISRSINFTCNFPFRTKLTKTYSRSTIYFRSPITRNTTTSLSTITRRATTRIITGKPIIDLVLDWTLKIWHKVTKFDLNFTIQNMSCSKPYYGYESYGHDHKDYYGYYWSLNPWISLLSGRESDILFLT